MTNAEINALVAEKVMDWTQRNDYWYDDAGHPQYPVSDIVYPDDAFNPAEDIACAWMVVEKMRSDGYDVQVDAMYRFQYGCRMAPHGEFNTPKVMFVAEDSAPLAICKAALSTKGIQVQ